MLVLLPGWAGWLVGWLPGWPAWLVGCLADEVGSWDWWQILNIFTWVSNGLSGICYAFLQGSLREVCHSYSVADPMHSSINYLSM